MAKKFNFKISSITPEGLKVLDDTFKLFDTHGLPLDTILELCQSYGMIPNWIDFYESAKNAGWTDKTVVNRLKTSITDVHGEEYCDEIMTRLEYYINKKET